MIISPFQIENIAAMVQSHSASYIAKMTGLPVSLILDILNGRKATHDQLPLFDGRCL